MALADTARLIAALELQDKFSATAAKYDRAIGGMERRTSSLSRIGNEVGRGTQAAIGNLTRIAAAGAVAIGSQVALGIRSLEQLEQVKNQTDAVIGSTKGVANVTAKEIRNLSEELENLTTVDDKVVQNGANVLLTFTKIRNEVGKGNDIFDQGVEAALNMSVALGTDMQQATIQVGKALNDPIRGVTALRRVGVQLTEQQEDQIKTFIESGETLKAQKVILAELETQFGKSGEAFGKGPGGAMRRFGDAVEGAQQALATGFLPLIEKVSARVQEVLGNPKVQREIKEFGVTAAGAIDNLIDIGAKLPWAAIGDAAKVMGVGAKALLDAFTSLPSWVQTAVLTGWGLNKLTGGALGTIVGELGKGLIKGVLNMNAAVVNINAGAVRGGPGGVPTPPRGGIPTGGFLGGLAITAGTALAGTAVAMTVDFGMQSRAQLEGIDASIKGLPRGTADELADSIGKVENAIDTANSGIVNSLVSQGTGLTGELERTRDGLKAELQYLGIGVQRGTTQAQQAAGVHAAKLEQIKTIEYGQERQQALQATRLEQVRNIEYGNSGTLQAIRDKKSSVDVTVNTVTNVAVSASEIYTRVTQQQNTKYPTQII